MAGVPDFKLSDCHRCRDSCVTDVATQDIGAPGGIRTPDPLIRSPVPVRVSSDRQFVRGTAIARTPFSSIPG